MFHRQVPGDHPSEGSLAKVMHVGAEPINWTRFKIHLQVQQDDDKEEGVCPLLAQLRIVGLVGCTQVHGTYVVHVDLPWAPGSGPKADAMVTRRPGLALGIITADCAPVLFADAEAGVVGAAHAGWRGAVAGIIEATVFEMVRLGARTDRIVAAVGPCIGQESYEVAADLRDAVVARAPDDARFFTDGTREARWQFNLPGYCAARLRAAGVAEVAVTGIDTLAEEDRFFSHRRRTLAGGGPIGHQISAIAIG